MKRIGNLYDEIASPDNVRAAILKASKGKRDRPQVRAVLDDLENKVLELSHALRTETVELHQYTADQRVEGSRNKKRIIHKPRFWPDQCVHWAIYNVMGAHLYRGFSVLAVHHGDSAHRLRYRIIGRAVAVRTC